MKSVYLRFYEELNDFLPEGKRKIKFEQEFKNRPSVKDLIQSLGIPHGEVDLILVNSISVDFNYLIQDGDEISVYPEFESLDIKNVQHLRSKPLRDPKFVLDVHLGTLAKYMRILGLDTLYSNKYSDEELIRISLEEKRTILTRDTGILKHSEVTHGYFVRSFIPRLQIEEIMSRFDLYEEVKQFSRCLQCNSLLKMISKEKIINRIPPKVNAGMTDFFICTKCDKIYWKGTHYMKMYEMIDKFLSTKK